MNSINSRWMFALVVGAAAATLSGPLQALDPGINQPGAMGNVGIAGVGVGAPGVGVWDPGFNQPGAMGNVGVAGVGVGAPGVGVWDPGFNQPGAIGNTGPARRSVRR